MCDSVSVRIQNRKIKKSIETESRSVVARGWVGGGEQEATA